MSDRKGKFIDYNSLPPNAKNLKKKEDKHDKERWQHVFIIRGSGTKDDGVDFNRHRQAVFDMDWFKMTNRNTPYYLVDVYPDKRQKEILDSLFSCPELIQSKIDRMEVKTFDVNTFLLENKISFYSLIGANYWSSYVGFLRAFTDSYIESDMITLEIPAGDNVSISRDYRVFIGLLGIGLLSCGEPNRAKMVQQRKYIEGMRYIKKFSIIKFKEQYYIKIRYDDDYFHLKKSRNLELELTGTFEVMAGKALREKMAESKRYARVDLHEDPNAYYGVSIVNHAHARNPKKKW